MKSEIPNKYSKIEENMLDWSKDYKKVKLWYVTEKIHGSNFSFVNEVQTNTIKYAKRNGIIEQDEIFFNYKSILPETEPKIKNIVENIKKDFENTKNIIIYGELFGGIYPNMSSEYTPVQKGVFYSSNIHFIAFDIYIDFIDGRSHYLSFEKSIDYFARAKIMYVEPLSTFSSYEKASHYELGFNSTIPIKFGLPELEMNKAEGIVIRGDFEKTNQRYIVKKKIPEFHETKYSDNKINVKDKKQIGLNMITANRLDNAISKIGILEDYRYQIYDLLVKDIFHELKITKTDEKKNLKKFFMEKIIELFGS